MTDGTVAGPTLPCPAVALERRFGEILAGPMREVPLLNPSLKVQAVGFRPWGPHWLGVMVTPWFMSLLLCPRDRDACHPVPERATRQHVFPAGVFEFIGNHDTALGDYQACSLFSPMFDFADQATAVATAAAALDALFDEASRVASIVPPEASAAPTAAATPPTTATAPALSKRDFLFGAGRREAREP